MGQEAHPVVRKPTRTSGKVRESHPKVWEGLGGTPGGLGRVGIPTRRSAKGRKFHPEVREGSGDTLEGPRRVGKPT